MTKLVIVGGVGGTNVGDSLRVAARDLGIDAALFDQREAMSPVRILQFLAWRYAGRRPLRLSAFSRKVLAACRQQAADVLITTGQAPVDAVTLASLRSLRVFLINFSTDDPWNPVHDAPWYKRALLEYDVVFTPRLANLADFERLGCKQVEHLPFAYDPNHFFPPAQLGASLDFSHDVLLVGGADRDRVAFVERMVAAGVSPALVGDYWRRFQITAPLAHGMASPENLNRLTAAAAVNVCIVRRANRDGHVMRSYEIPAVGGFLIAEDTAEHRTMFGAEGECVLYFGTPEEAADKARWALAHPEERVRMARAAHKRIVEGGNTYRDRLVRMLASCPRVAASHSADASHCPRVMT